jgi:hypothetical protein
VEHAHEPAGPGPAARYEIRVQGALDESWADWCGGLTIEVHDGVTTLSGVLADQAALRGVLCRLWDLHLTLLGVRRVECGGKEAR